MSGSRLVRRNYAIGVIAACGGVCLFSHILSLGRGAGRANGRECSGGGARASDGPKGETRRGVQLRVSRLCEQHHSGHKEQRQPARAPSHIRLRCSLRHYYYAGRQLI